MAEHSLDEPDVGRVHIVAHELDACWSEKLLAQPSHRLGRLRPGRGWRNTKMEAALPFPFRPIERRIGTVREFVEIGPVVGRYGNADAGGYLERMSVDEIGLAELLDHAAGKHLGFIVMIDAFLDDDKFISAQPCNRILRTDGPCKA